MTLHFFRTPPDREDEEDDDPLEEPPLEPEDEREGALNDLDGETELLDGGLKLRDGGLTLLDGAEVLREGVSVLLGDTLEFLEERPELREGALLENGTVSFPATPRSLMIL